MKIEKDKADQIISRLNILAPSGITCPICGNKEWSLGDKIFETREFQNGNIILNGKSSIMPFVPLTCNNCGYTIILNALKYDLIKKDEENMDLKQTEQHGK